ncbi:MAG: hypothetical protein ABIH37_01680 [archaeon]
MAQRAFRSNPNPGYFERFMLRVVDGLESLVEGGYRLSGQTNYLVKYHNTPDTPDSDKDQNSRYEK